MGDFSERFTVSSGKVRGRSLRSLLVHVNASLARRAAEETLNDDVVVSQLNDDINKHTRTHNLQTLKHGHGCIKLLKAACITWSIGVIP